MYEVEIKIALSWWDIFTFLLLYSTPILAVITFFRNRNIYWNFFCCCYRSHRKIIYPTREIYILYKFIPYCLFLVKRVKKDNAWSSKRERRNFILKRFH